jgi:sugar phosphate isomerase/epimerase
MVRARVTLSAFGDEVSRDLGEQLQVLRDLQIGYLELRDVWGKNVLHLDDEDVVRVRQTCAEHDMAISCIGSPVGKSSINEPIEDEASNLARIFQIAEAVGTRNVRVFSFYPPDTSSNARYDEYVEEATARLAHLARMAERAGFFLMLENEKEIVGDTQERCHAILTAINSPNLRFLWDPGNFVQIGVAEPTTQGWPLLGSFLSYVHIKDAVLSDGSIRAPGKGDGQIPELISKLNECGYRGFLALEPHLAIAGHSGGFSGVEGMRHAVNSLRQLLTASGIETAE